MPTKKRVISEEAESEVYNVIAAFEEILQAMPTDRVALETLEEAYEKIGDQAHALDYLVRLAQVISEEGDRTAAPGLVEKLQKMGGEDATAKAAVENLKQLVSAKQEAAEPPAAARKKRRTVDITAELALAWNLLQAQEISQDDYTSIVQDLTESSTKKIDTPISVLHVLHDRQFKNEGKILNYLARESGLPIIALDRFDIQLDVFNLLPHEFPTQRGAAVFEMMGQDPLVAILNPYDTELRHDIEKLLDAKCHFYLVEAAGYDQLLTKMRQAAADEKPGGHAREGSAQKK